MAWTVLYMLDRLTEMGHLPSHVRQQGPSVGLLHSISGHVRLEHFTLPFCSAQGQKSVNIYK